MSRGVRGVAHRMSRRVSSVVDLAGRDMRGVVDGLSGGVRGVGQGALRLVVNRQPVRRSELNRLRRAVSHEIAAASCCVLIDVAQHLPHLLEAVLEGLAIVEGRLGDEALLLAAVHCVLGHLHHGAFSVILVLDAAADTHHWLTGDAPLAREVCIIPNEGLAIIRSAELVARLARDRVVVVMASVLELAVLVVLRDGDAPQLLLHLEPLLLVGRVVVLGVLLGAAVERAVVALGDRVEAEAAPLVLEEDLHRRLREEQLAVPAQREAQRVRRRVEHRHHDGAVGRRASPPLAEDVGRLQDARDGELEAPAAHVDLGGLRGVLALDVRRLADDGERGAHQQLDGRRREGQEDERGGAADHHVRRVGERVVEPLQLRLGQLLAHPPPPLVAARVCHQEDGHRQVAARQRERQRRVAVRVDQVCVGALAQQHESEDGVLVLDRQAEGRPPRLVLGLDVGARLEQLQRVLDIALERRLHQALVALVDCDLRGRLGQCCRHDPLDTALLA